MTDLKSSSIHILYFVLSNAISQPLPRRTLNDIVYNLYMFFKSVKYRLNKVHTDLKNIHKMYNMIEGSSTSVLTTRNLLFA